MKYSIGNRVVFGKFAGVDYKNNMGKDCVILAETEILGEEVPLPLVETAATHHDYFAQAPTQEITQCAAEPEACPCGRTDQHESTIHCFPY
jgi:HD superfamily phosphohydrolase YqeK